MSQMQLVTVKNPFRRTEREVQTLDYHYESIQSIYDCIISRNVPKDMGIVISVNGLPIEPQFWNTTVPRPGDQIVVMPVVEGDDKQVLGAIMMIAVAVVAPGIGGALAAGLGFSGTTAGLLFGAGIAIAGGLLINSLMPTPSSAYDDSSKSATYGWSPQTTQEQGLVVPRWYGKNKLYGNVVAAHTEIDEADETKQLLKMLMALGSGPVEGIVAGSIKINDQPAEYYEDVTTEEKKGTLNQTAVSFFDKTKAQYQPNFIVTYANPRTYTTPDSDYDDLEIELLFDRGLYHVNDQGSLSNHIIGVKVEISEAGEESWTTLVEDEITGKTSTAIRVNYIASETYTGGSPVSITNGKAYDIKVTKTSEDETSVRYGDRLILGTIREVLNDQFIYPLTPLLAIEALATDQLSGSLSVSCIQQGRIVMTYNGSIWTLQYSTNPAWIMWDVLTEPVISGDGDGTPYAIERYDGYDPADMDLPKFYELAQFCDTMVPDGSGSTEKRITFNGGFDTATNRWDAALRIAEIARCIPYFRGSQISLAIDKAADATFMFTIGNIAKGTFREMFMPLADRASEIEINYRDESQDFERVPFTVYDSDIDTVNRVTLDLFGTTSQSQAYRLAMQRLGKNRLLKSTIQFDADIDAVTCTLGENGWIQHDIPEWGDGGRVVSGDTAYVIVDQDMEYAAGETYRLLVRRSDDTHEDKTVLSIYNPITGVNQGNKQFQIAGDYSSAYKSGDTIRLADSTGNDADYTLASDATYATGTTTITVTTAIPNGTADGGLYNLRRIVVTTAFSPLSAVITVVDQAKKQFGLNTDASAMFKTGDTLIVINSTGNDGEYTIVSDSYHDGSTTIVTVSEAIPDATVDGNAYNEDYESPRQHDVYTFGLQTFPAKRYSIIGVEVTSEQHVTITAIEYKAELYDLDNDVPVIPISDYSPPNSTGAITHAPTWDEISNRYPAEILDNGLNIDVPLTTNLLWNSNTPTPPAGQVSWSKADGVNPILLSYKGTVYEITAAYTSSKYIYWDTNYTTSFQTSNTLADAIGNGKWLMCYNDSGMAYPPFAQKVIHGGIIQAGTITASQMATGTITAASGVIADLAVTTLKIAGLNVTTEKIANNATQILGMATKASIQNLTTSYTKLVEAAIISEGNQIRIRGSCIFEDISSNSTDADIAITRGENTLYEYEVAGVYQMVLGEQMQVAIEWYDTPGIGEKTYKLKVKADVANRIGARYSMLEISEWKGK
jgi:hypothetical protein